MRRASLRNQLRLSALHAQDELTCSQPPRVPACPPFAPECPRTHDRRSGRLRARGVRHVCDLGGDRYARHQCHGIALLRSSLCRPSSLPAAASTPLKNSRISAPPGTRGQGRAGPTCACCISSRAGQRKAGIKVALAPPLVPLVLLSVLFASHSGRETAIQLPPVLPQARIRSS